MRRRPAVLRADDPRRFTILCKLCGSRVAFRVPQGGAHVWVRNEAFDGETGDLVLGAPVETAHDGRPLGLSCRGARCDGRGVEISDEQWPGVLAAKEHPRRHAVIVRA
jgi:hypothetical protein